MPLSKIPLSFAGDIILFFNRIHKVSMHLFSLSVRCSLLLVFWGVGRELLAQTPEVEMVFQTNGSVFLSGRAKAKQAGLGKAASKKQEQLVKRAEEGNKVLLFTNKNKDLSHDELDIELPEGADAHLSMQEGNLAVEKWSGRLNARLKKGNITAVGIKGEVDWRTEEGDIAITEADLTGGILALNGSVRLVDVSGGVAPLAPKGDVHIELSENYFKKRPEVVRLSASRGTLHLHQVPEGGEIHWGAGQIRAANIRKPLTVRTEQATIRLEELAAPLDVESYAHTYVALSRQFKNDDPTQYVRIEVHGADLELRIPRQFDGILQLWHTGVNFTERPAVISTFELGKPKIAETSNEDNSMRVRETSYAQKLGKGGTPIFVHCTNGTITLLHER